MKYVVSILCGSVVFVGQAQQPGDLDSSFAQNGKIVLESYGNTKSLALQGDGKILVLTPEALIRFNENGSIDSTFASEGSFEIGATQVLLQSDDKILLIGGGVTRLYSDGSQDTSYSFTSPLTASFGLGVLLPDDQLVLFGFSPSNDYYYREIVCKFNNDGTLDTSFSGDGYFLGSNYLQNYAGAGLSSEGEIFYLYSGSTPAPFPWYYVRLMRLTQDGQTSIVSESSQAAAQWFLSCPRSLAFSPSGNLMIVSSTCSQSYPPSLSTWSWGVGCSSSVDNYASSNGTNITQLGYPTGYAPKYANIAIDAADNFFISGRFEENLFEVFTSSGCDGTLWSIDYMSTSFEGYNLMSSEKVVVQPDGKVLVGGWVRSEDLDSPPHLALARFHNIADPRSLLNLKMFLGGAYDGAEGLMRDDLRQAGYVPFVQPYTSLGFLPVNGVGSWGSGPGVFELEGDNAIVDWVWIELLDPDNPSIVRATRAGMLHRNGIVTQANGFSPLDFSVGTGTFYLRIHHRNHLPVTLLDPITLGPDPIMVDMSSPMSEVFGDNSRMEVNGVMMLWPGDATGNGEVKYVGSMNDRDKILITIGGTIPAAIQTGYHMSDVNLDGIVKYIGSENDRDLILQVLDGLPTGIQIRQDP